MDVTNLDQVDVNHDVTPGSSNVFADLGLPDAEKLLEIAEWGHKHGYTSFQDAEKAYEAQKEK